MSIFEIDPIFAKKSYLKKKWGAVSPPPKREIGLTNNIKRFFSYPLFANLYSFST